MEWGALSAIAGLLTLAWRWASGLRSDARAVVDDLRIDLRDDVAKILERIDELMQHVHAHDRADAAVHAEHREQIRQLAGDVVDAKRRLSKLEGRHDAA